MRTVLWVGMVAGCNLQGGAADPDVIARECIQTVDSGPTLGSGPLAIVLSSTCSGSARIQNLQYHGDTLSETTSFEELGARYHRLVIAELDGAPGVETVGLVDSSSYVAFVGISLVQPTRVDYARPFDDLAITDVNADGQPDVVVAGDAALRVSLGTPDAFPSPTDELTLLSDKRFTAVAATQLGVERAPALAFLATALDGSGGELGIARQTSSAPPAFTIEDTIPSHGEPTVPLQVADVDGDGVPDVIGATEELFVRSGKHGTFSFYPDSARSLALGDLDGDGILDPIFVGADGASVSRLRIAPDGALSVEPLLETEADALTVGDFDNDGSLDVAVVRRLGRGDSTLAVYRGLGLGAD
jgi:hypothetical protein